MNSGTPAIRVWYAVHKWSSLICTLFLLLICLTGLPLIFNAEIDHWLDNDKPHARVPERTALVNLDAIVDRAIALYPHDVVNSIYIDHERPRVVVSMAPTLEAPRRLRHSLSFDAHTSELLKDAAPSFAAKSSFMGTVLVLHRNAFAGNWGEWFLGLMGLLFIAAIITGVRLYGPFMKKLEFGSVRSTRSRRLKWLDLHNVLGIVTVVWAGVVSLTGVLNEIAAPLSGSWQKAEMSRLVAAHANGRLPESRASVQNVSRAVQQAMPGYAITSISYPGTRSATPQHYVVRTRGSAGLASHVSTPVLVDAGMARIVAVTDPPWYVTALALSKPLHFGDYGGLPLKILWALLDVLTIVVLGSGLYLWFARRKAGAARLVGLTRPPRADPPEVRA